MCCDFINNNGYIFLDTGSISLTRYSYYKHFIRFMFLINKLCLRNSY